MKPMSADFEDKLRDLQLRANTTGQDYMALLNRNGMLATSERIKQIQIATLELACDRLAAQGAAKLLQYYYQKPQGTPEEMLRAVNLWMEDLFSALVNDTLYD